MKALKKVMAVLLACLFVFTSVQMIASAEDEQQLQAVQTEDVVSAEGIILYEGTETTADEEGMVVAQMNSPGQIVGRILGTIVFSPFLLIDFIVWVFSGFNVHIFYSWLYD